MNIAIIPARGGSQRIPQKNIKDFLGKPLISYSIAAALNSSLFDQVIVSTDDEKIAEIAKQQGAEVPFLRSSENSSDHAPTIDVLIEVLEQLKLEKINDCSVCCIYPTAPFITAARIKEAFDIFTTENFDSLLPVTTFDFPIQRAFQMTEKKSVQWREPESALTRSQDLKPYYHDAGQFYWLKASTILSKKQIITENTGGLAISPMEVQDIDDPSDWEMAEFKYSFLRNQKA